ncbi:MULTISPECIES: DUF1819 family protein [unclassified Halomonas]|uniref:DUF1819 family protein n=1 Tax=Halomonadaceae TaxID=28256 RepID=UPI0002E73438|nr:MULTISPECIES: DUF1819 family protein [unclassified Halomonas]PKG49002.1 DUF1819 domain-containing protein [Halomonas sp. MES3-P3E]WKV94734.1 DUF1819 family protein [Halomonas sp. HAL1]
MTLSFSYNSDLIGGGLMVRESRAVAALLLDEVDEAHWHQAIIVENRLQKNRPATAKRAAQAIRKRLEKLEPSFWKALHDGDDQLASQVSFCAAMARNLLMVEFLESVVADAFLTRSEKLQSYQWDEFLAERANRDAAIATWAESSRRKMGQVVFRMLTEVGILDSSRSRRLQSFLPRPELKMLLETHRHTRLQNCLQKLR